MIQCLQWLKMEKYGSLKVIIGEFQVEWAVFLEHNKKETSTWNTQCLNNEPQYLKTFIFSTYKCQDLMLSLSHTEEGGMRPWNMHEEKINTFKFCGLLFLNSSSFFFSFFMNGNTEQAHCALSQVCILNTLSGRRHIGASSKKLT